MSPTDKPIVWLVEPARTPPIARGARIEIGYLLPRLQAGERLGLPTSRPMPGIERRVAELRVTDGTGNIEVRGRRTAFCTGVAVAASVAS